MDEKVIQDLKNCIDRENITEISNIIRSLEKEGIDWLKIIKIRNVIEDPTSYKFDINKLYILTNALMQTKDYLSLNMFADYMSYYQSLLNFYKYSESLNNKFYNLECLSDSPIKLIQKMLIFLENQSRLSTELNIKENSDIKIIDYNNLLKSNMKSDVNGSSISITDNYEGIMGSIDVVLRYLFWKNRNNINGILDENANPYNTPSLYDLITLSTLRAVISSLWSAIKYRDWSFLREVNGPFCYVPKNLDEYTKGEAAVLRSRMFMVEFTYTLMTIPIFRNSISKFSAIIKDVVIDIRNKSWYLIIPNEIINELMGLDSLFEISLFHLLDNIYKKKIDDILIGPPNNSISGKDFIGIYKYLYIISLIYQQNAHNLVMHEEIENLSLLVPTVHKKTLASKIGKTLNLEKRIIINVINLLTFNPDKTKLDLYLQPLIPINNQISLLVPNLIKDLNLLRFFESHFLQWNISLEDRGPIFEKEIRETFLKAKIPVARNSIKFNASDGKQIEYDVFVYWDNFLVLIEAKCICTPYSHFDKFESWKHINKGIAQLNRREIIAKSDWKLLREISKIELPEDPPENVIKILITNIFNFTGIIKDDVLISDYMALNKYLSGDDAEKIIVGNDGIKSKELFHKLWKDDEPKPLEMYEFLKEPIGLKNILPSCVGEFSPLPILDDGNERIEFFRIITK